MSFLPSRAAAAVLAAALNVTPAPAASAPAAPAADDPLAVWDLTPLYRDEAAWRAAKDRLAAELPALGAFAGRLGEGPGVLLEALVAIEQRTRELIRLYSYASLQADEDTRLAPPLERRQEMGLLGSQFSRTVSYLRPELLALGAERIEAYLAAEPRLAPHRFPLREILRGAPHTLGAEAEAVLSATSLVTGSAGSIYGVLANADLPWPTIRLADGTEARLDQAGYTRWRAAPSRSDREAVFRAFWGRMREYERTFGAALFAQVKADWFNASVRRHPSSLASALHADAIPEAVYRTLIAETNAGLPTLHRYFRLRGRLLGIKDLRYWDIYPAMLPGERAFPLDEARRLTLASAAPLGADYGRDLAHALAGRYLHAYPRPGKTSGAYMSGRVHDAHPYVLMNYNGDYESLTTFAHEWGHGIHSVLANRAQPAPTADYPIFTAEIASTVNEALLLEHMLRVATSDRERLAFLGSALEGLRGTFFRQAMFAEFELAMHEVVQRGGALSGQRLSQLYGDLLRRHHGHAEGVLTIDDLVTVEWAYIPHFYSRFYVYQYATSIAAAQLFANRILAGEPGAVDTYLGLLKAGGSDHPYELVRRAGVDLATPAPYRALIARMDAIMDRIEALLPAGS